MEAVFHRVRNVELYGILLLTTFDILNSHDGHNNRTDNNSSLASQALTFSKREDLVAEYPVLNQEALITPRFSCDFSASCISVWVVEPKCWNGFLEVPGKGYIKISLKFFHCQIHDFNMSSFAVHWLWGSEHDHLNEISRCRHLNVCRVPVLAVRYSSSTKHWLNILLGLDDGSFAGIISLVADYKLLKKNLTLKNTVTIQRLKQSDIVLHRNKKHAASPIKTVERKPVRKMKAAVGRNKRYIPSSLIKLRQEIKTTERELADALESLNKDKWKYRKHVNLLGSGFTYPSQSRVDHFTNKLAELKAKYNQEYKDSGAVLKPHGRLLMSPIWGLWTSWSKCSVDCGDGGFSVRRRQCESLPDIACSGISFDMRSCSIGTRCEATFHDWGNWGPCSVTCGKGVRARSRVCVSGDKNVKCQGSSTMLEKCTFPHCRSRTVGKSSEVVHGGIPQPVPVISGPPMAFILSPAFAAGANTYQVPPASGIIAPNYYRPSFGYAAGGGAAGAGVGVAGAGVGVAAGGVMQTKLSKVSAQKGPIKKATVIENEGNNGPTVITEHEIASAAPDEESDEDEIVPTETIVYIVMALLCLLLLLIVFCIYFYQRIKESLAQKKLKDARPFYKSDDGNDDDLNKKSMQGKVKPVLRGNYAGQSDASQPDQNGTKKKSQSSPVAKPKPKVKPKARTETSPEKQPSPVVATKPETKPKPKTRTKTSELVKPSEVAQSSTKEQPSPVVKPSEVEQSMTEEQPSPVATLKLQKKPRPGVKHKTQTKTSPLVKPDEVEQSSTEEQPSPVATLKRQKKPKPGVKHKTKTSPLVKPSEVEQSSTEEQPSPAVTLKLQKKPRPGVKPSEVAQSSTEEQPSPVVTPKPQKKRSPKGKRSSKGKLKPEIKSSPVEHLSPEEESNLEVQSSPGVKLKSALKSRPEVQPNPEEQSSRSEQSSPEVKLKSALKSRPEVQPNPEVQPDPEVQPNPEVQPSQEEEYSKTAQPEETVQPSEIVQPDEIVQPSEKRKSVRMGSIEIIDGGLEMKSDKEDDEVEPQEIFEAESNENPQQVVDEEEKRDDEDEDENQQVEITEGEVSESTGGDRNTSAELTYEIIDEIPPKDLTYVVTDEIEQTDNTNKTIAWSFDENQMARQAFARRSGAQIGGHADSRSHANSGSLQNDNKLPHASKLKEYMKNEGHIQYTLHSASHWQYPAFEIKQIQHPGYGDQHQKIESDNYEHKSLFSPDHITFTENTSSKCHSPKFYLANEIGESYWEFIRHSEINSEYPNGKLKRKCKKLKRSLKRKRAYQKPKRKMSRYYKTSSSPDHKKRPGRNGKILQYYRKPKRCRFNLVIHKHIEEIDAQDRAAKSSKKKCTVQASSDSDICSRGDSTIISTSSFCTSTLSASNTEVLERYVEKPQTAVSDNIRHKRKLEAKVNAFKFKIKDSQADRKLIKSFDQISNPSIHHQFPVKCPLKMCSSSQSSETHIQKKEKFSVSSSSWLSMLLSESDKKLNEIDKDIDTVLTEQCQFQCREDTQLSSNVESIETSQSMNISKSRTILGRYQLEIGDIQDSNECERYRNEGMKDELVGQEDGAIHRTQKLKGPKHASQKLSLRDEEPTNLDKGQRQESYEKKKEDILKLLHSTSLYQSRGQSMYYPDPMKPIVPQKMLCCDQTQAGQLLLNAIDLRAEILNRDVTHSTENTSSKTGSSQGSHPASAAQAYQNYKVDFNITSGSQIPVSSVSHKILTGSSEMKTNKHFDPTQSVSCKALDEIWQTEKSKILSTPVTSESCAPSSDTFVKMPKKVSEDTNRATLVLNTGNLVVSLDMHTHGNEQDYGHIKFQEHKDKQSEYVTHSGGSTDKLCKQTGDTKKMLKTSGAQIIPLNPNLPKFKGLHMPLSCKDNLDKNERSLASINQSDRKLDSKCKKQRNIQPERWSGHGHVPVCSHADTIICSCSSERKNTFEMIDDLRQDIDDDDQSSVKIKKHPGDFKLPASDDHMHIRHVPVSQKYNKERYEQILDKELDSFVDSTSWISSKDYSQIHIEWDSNKDSNRKGFNMPLTFLSPHNTTFFKSGTTLEMTLIQSCNNDHTKPLMSMFNKSLKVGQDASKEKPQNRQQSDKPDSAYLVQEQASKMQKDYQNCSQTSHQSYQSFPHSYLSTNANKPVISKSAEELTEETKCFSASSGSMSTDVHKQYFSLHEPHFENFTRQNGETEETSDSFASFCDKFSTPGSQTSWRTATTNDSIYRSLCKSDDSIYETNISGNSRVPCSLKSTFLLPSAESINNSEIIDAEIKLSNISTHCGLDTECFISASPDNTVTSNMPIFQGTKSANDNLLIISSTGIEGSSNICYRNTSQAESYKSEKTSTSSSNIFTSKPESCNVTFSSPGNINKSTSFCVPEKDQKTSKHSRQASLLCDHCLDGFEKLKPEINQSSSLLESNLKRDYFTPPSKLDKTFILTSDRTSLTGDTDSTYTMPCNYFMTESSEHSTGDLAYTESSPRLGSQVDRTFSRDKKLKNCSNDLMILSSESIMDTHIPKLYCASESYADSYKNSSPENCVISRSEEITVGNNTESVKPYMLSEIEYTEYLLSEARETDKNNSIQTQMDKPDDVRTIANNENVQKFHNVGECAKFINEKINGSKDYVGHNIQSFSARFDLTAAFYKRAIQWSPIFDRGTDEDASVNTTSGVMQHQTLYSSPAAIVSSGQTQTDLKIAESHNMQSCCSSDNKQASSLHSMENNSSHTAQIFTTKIQSVVKSETSKSEFNQNIDKIEQPSPAYAIYILKKEKYLSSQHSLTEECYEVLDMSQNSAFISDNIPSESHLTTGSQMSNTSQGISLITEDRTLIEAADRSQQTLIAGLESYHSTEETSVRIISESSNKSCLNSCTTCSVFNEQKIKLQSVQNKRCALIKDYESDVNIFKNINVHDVGKGGASKSTGKNTPKNNEAQRKQERASFLNMSVDPDLKSAFPEAPDKDVSSQDTAYSDVSVEMKGKNGKTNSLNLSLNPDLKLAVMEVPYCDSKTQKAICSDNSLYASSSYALLSLSLSDGCGQDSHQIASSFNGREKNADQRSKKNLLACCDGESTSPVSSLDKSSPQKINSCSTDFLGDHISRKRVSQKTSRKQDLSDMTDSEYSHIEYMKAFLPGSPHLVQSSMSEASFNSQSSSGENCFSTVNQSYISHNSLDEGDCLSAANQSYISHNSLDEGDCLSAANQSYISHNSLDEKQCCLTLNDSSSSHSFSAGQNLRCKCAHELEIVHRPFLKQVSFVHDKSDDLTLLKSSVMTCGELTCSPYQDSRSDVSITDTYTPCRSSKFIDSLNWVESVHSQTSPQNSVSGESNTHIHTNLQRNVVGDDSSHPEIVEEFRRPQMFGIESMTEECRERERNTHKYNDYKSVLHNKKAIYTETGAKCTAKIYEKQTRKFIEPDEHCPGSYKDGISEVSNQSFNRDDPELIMYNFRSSPGVDNSNLSTNSLVEDNKSKAVQIVSGSECVEQTKSALGHEFLSQSLVQESSSFVSQTTSESMATDITCGTIQSSSEGTPSKVLTCSYQIVDLPGFSAGVRELEGSISQPVIIYPSLDGNKTSSNKISRESNALPVADLAHQKIIQYASKDKCWTPKGHGERCHDEVNSAYHHDEDCHLQNNASLDSKIKLSTSSAGEHYSHTVNNASISVATCAQHPDKKYLAWVSDRPNVHQSALSERCTDKYMLHNKHPRHHGRVCSTRGKTRKENEDNMTLQQRDAGSTETYMKQDSDQVISESLEQVGNCGCSESVMTKWSSQDFESTMANYGCYNSSQASNLSNHSSSSNEQSCTCSWCADSSLNYDCSKTEIYVGTDSVPSVCTDSFRRSSPRHSIQKSAHSISLTNVCQHGLGSQCGLTNRPACVDESAILYTSSLHEDLNYDGILCSFKSAIEKSHQDKTVPLPSLYSTIRSPANGSTSLSLQSDVYLARRGRVLSQIESSECSTTDRSCVLLDTNCHSMSRNRDAISYSQGNHTFYSCHSLQSFDSSKDSGDLIDDSSFTHFDRSVNCDASLSIPIRSDTTQHSSNNSNNYTKRSHGDSRNTSHNLDSLWNQSTLISYSINASCHSSDVYNQNGLSFSLAKSYSDLRQQSFSRRVDLHAVSSKSESSSHLHKDLHRGVTGRYDVSQNIRLYRTHHRNKSFSKKNT